MNAQRTYLDYNATAPVRPAVREAMVEALATVGNPSSVHAEGRAARGRVEDARLEVAALVDADPQDVIFTSGGTEANVLALRGAIAGQGVETLIVSAIEHPSVLQTARLAGVRTLEIPAAADGAIELDALAACLARADGRCLVSVMAANNETGAVQPVEEASALARDHGALMHVDAVQAAGRLALGPMTSGADMITLSAHKIGGPQGIGALIVRDGADPAPVLTGGGQERRLRAGTENVAAIAGFAAAAACVRKETEEPGRLAEMRDRLEADIVADIDGAVVFGSGTVRRLANTTCLAVPGISAEFLVMALDLAGFAVSSGAACSSGKVTRSHVLEAMGIEPALAAGAIRVSTGWATTPDEIARFSQALKDICTREAARSGLAA